MSKTTRATTTNGAASPSTTTLRASARPLRDSYYAFTDDFENVPPHVEPFKPFDWTSAAMPCDNESADRKALRQVLNTNINALTGAALCLRMIEHSQIISEQGPLVIELPDGTGFEQPNVPYLDVGDRSMVMVMVATLLDYVVRDSHEQAQQLQG